MKQFRDTFYKVSEDGKIFGVRKEQNPSINKDGYAVVGRWFVHRMIAECYLPNPNNFRYVNHKDGDKLNNSLDNLEWVTSSQNRKHAVDVLGHKNGRTRKFNQPLRRKIAAMYNTGNYSYSELGRLFGISDVTVKSYVKEFSA